MRRAKSRKTQRRIKECRPANQGMQVDESRNAVRRIKECKQANQGIWKGRNQEDQSANPGTQATRLTESNRERNLTKNSASLNWMLQLRKTAARKTAISRYNCLHDGLSLHKHQNMLLNWLLQLRKNAARKTQYPKP